MGLNTAVRGEKKSERPITLMAPPAPAVSHPPTLWDCVLVPTTGLLPFVFFTVTSLPTVMNVHADAENPLWRAVLGRGRRRACVGAMSRSPQRGRG